MRLDLNGRSEQYNGPVHIAFATNEHVTLRTTDGRTVDVFADGSWQVWGRGGREADDLIGQGTFHALPEPAAE